jgi:hypothetical protein
MPKAEPSPQRIRPLRLPSGTEEAPGRVQFGRDMPPKVPQLIEGSDLL